MTDQQPPEDEYPTVIALPVFQPEVPGARPYSRDELIELLDRQMQQAVQGVADAAAAFNRHADALDRAVRSARQAGVGWADVGRAVGISRQAAQQRWQKRLDQ